MSQVSTLRGSSKQRTQKPLSGQEKRSAKSLGSALKGLVIPSK